MERVGGKETRAFIILAIRLLPHYRVILSRWRTASEVHVKTACSKRYTVAELACACAVDLARVLGWKVARLSVHGNATLQPSGRLSSSSCSVRPVWVGGTWGGQMGVGGGGGLGKLLRTFAPEIELN